MTKVSLTENSWNHMQSLSNLIHFLLLIFIPSSHSLSTQAPSSRLVDQDLLVDTIRQGRVYQHTDFISEGQVQVLLAEVKELQESGKFVRSGLSNNAEKDNRFGRDDRSICAVPWWSESLQGNVSGCPLSNVLQDLRMELASVLNRPTMTINHLAHECYYSTGGVGSFLPRHMDERHEELKGAKGWLLPSRRSLSWLIYLSDEGWELERNGGSLRTFPQDRIASGAHGSTHRGNLQAGWYRTSNGATGVYLDSWFQLPETPEPHCVLYMVDANNETVFLTRPWLNDALQGMSANDFLAKWANEDSAVTKEATLFLKRAYAKNFSLLEDRDAWDVGKQPANSMVEDIVPLRGSLVIFDSVNLPHQVELVLEGTRIAMAGWFHEETQSSLEFLYRFDGTGEL